MHFSILIFHPDFKVLRQIISKLFALFLGVFLCFFVWVFYSQTLGYRVRTPTINHILLAHALHSTATIDLHMNCNIILQITKIHLQNGHIGKNKNTVTIGSRGPALVSTLILLVTSSSSTRFDLVSILVAFRIMNFHYG